MIRSNGNSHRLIQIATTRLISKAVSRSMTPPPPPSKGEDFLPVLTAETEQPPATTTTSRPVDHAPAGTPEETQRILHGLGSGSLGRTIALPTPRLVHDFRLSARLERKVALGRSCWGERNWIGICGGDWAATWGRGSVVVWIRRCRVPGLVLALGSMTGWPAAGWLTD